MRLHQPDFLHRMRKSPRAEQRLQVLGKCHNAAQVGGIGSMLIRTSVDLLQDPTMATLLSTEGQLRDARGLISMLGKHRDRSSPRT